MGALDDLRAAFGTKGEFAAGKVSSYLNGLAKGTATADERLGVMQNFLDKTKTMGEAIQSGFKRPLAPEQDIGAALERLTQSAADAKTATDAVVNGVKPQKGLAQTFAGLRGGAEGGEARAGMLGMASEGAHAIGLHAAAPLLGGALTALNLAKSVPYRAIQVMGALQRMASFARQASRSAVTDAIEGGTHVSPAAMAGEDSLRGVDLAGGKAPAGETLREAAARVSNQVRELAGDQAGALQRVSGATEGIANHAPNIAAHVTATALRGLQWLALKAPSNPYQGIGFAPAETDAAWTPSQAKSEDFEKHVLGALYPYRTLRRVADGTATPQEIEALKAVWPNLHGDVAGAIKAKIMKSPGKLASMSPARRTMLSRFTGAPADPSHSPQAVAAFQSIYAQPMRPPAPNKMPKQHKMPVSGKFTLAKRMSLGNHEE
jgi:hypothetical protein